MQNARELAEFEETVKTNHLPLSKWKDEERVFLEQMMDDTVSDQKDIKNPYQPPPDTSTYCSPILVLIIVNKKAVAPSMKKVRDMLEAEDNARRTRSQKRKQSDIEAGEEASEELRLTQLFLDGLDIERTQ